MTNKKVAELASNLLAKGHTLKQAGEALGIKDKHTVQKYARLAVVYAVKTDKPAMPSNTTFAQNPYIVPWLNDMNTRVEGSKPIANAQAYYRKLEILFTSTKSTPNMIFASGDHLEILEAGRALVKSFLTLYRNHDTTQKSYKARSSNNVRRSMAMPLRDLMSFHGHQYPAKEKGVMSAAKISHGNFADLHITPEQYEAIKLAIKKRHGINNDIFRTFSIGVETMARDKALWSASSKHQEVKTQDGKTFLILRIYENKTKTTWDKFVYSQDTQDAIKKVAQQSQFLIENRSQSNAKKIKNALRRAYQDAGISYITTDEIEPGFNSAPYDYFQEKPMHSLRHIGAQLWLKMTNWDFGLVADMGWKTLDELRTSYGKMPAAIKSEKVQMAIMGGSK